MRTYHMTTHNLGFSQWAEEDYPLAQALWGNADVARYISAAGAFTEQEIRARLSREVENGRAHDVQYWPVFVRGTGQFAGCCGLRPYDLPASIYEFGVHLLPAYWGRGYATEAGRAVIDHAFDNMGAANLFAGHNPHNTASQKMLEKLGFHYVRHEYYAPTGLQHPSYLYR